MHRKHVRRWHKLLSVSGVLVAIFGGLTIPMANAATGDTTPLGIYGMSYYNGATQVQYIDFPGNVSGLETTDFYFTGTATGCLLYPVPNITGFSFSVTITNCSEGTFHLNLKANSVTDSKNVTGPATDFIGDINEINRQTPTAQFQNVPASVSTGQIVFEVAVNHPLQNNGPYNVTVYGSGCVLDSSIRTSYGMQFALNSCDPGAQAKITVNPMILKDVYGNLGPATAITSPMVLVDVEASSPLPTSSPTANPSSSPTASPTPTPVDTPTPTPTPPDTPASVAVAVPPKEPPSAPAPPASQEPIPVVAPVVEVAPIAPEPEPVFESPVLSLSPIAMVRSKIVQVRKSFAAPKPVEPVVEETQIHVEPPAQVISPTIETTARPSFNWQPIGYLALAVGGAAAVVGGGLLLQRMIKVRRLRFS